MRRLLIVPLLLASLLAGGASRIVQDQCGPFTDVTPAFCPYILELYYLGVTAGTSATTFSPDDPLTRGQGSVFVAKGLNQALARSSRRAALGQWWTTTDLSSGLGTTNVGDSLTLCISDGADIWAGGELTVSRIHASDGRLLETWTGATNSFGMVAALGRIFVAGQTPAGDLYMIDPSQPAGPVSVVATNLGPLVAGMTFDGSRFWVAHLNGTVSVVTPSATTPWPVTHPTLSLIAADGILFDGSHIWVTDTDNEQPRASRLVELDSDGNLLLTLPVGNGAAFLAFDGANVWVPNAFSGSISVVNAASGTVVSTLTGNGLVQPESIAFDGVRMLVTDFGTPGLSIWRAADLSPLGFVSTPPGPFGSCSDGINFWIAFFSGAVVRF